MSEKDLKRIVSNLSIWKRNDERAPHKPLLLLLALAKLQHGESVLHYEDTRIKLKKLLIEFGPKRKTYHPEEPFVRLTTDKIWKLNKSVDKNNFSDRKLVAEQITGQFQSDVWDLLNANGRLVQEITEQLLHEHFPDTIHQDLIEEIGLQFSMTTKRRRDPEFRNRVLKAYEYGCAICGFNVRLGHNLVGVDAAHIQWHQAGGPDHEENGIALCVLHHKLFDRGVFTITNDREILVAEEAHGTHGFEEWLMKYHGTTVRAPIRPLYQPKITFLEWHIREVFRGPARYSEKKL
ncbi:phosphorothioated DNA-binding restriction endonuclease [Paenibacillus radicis (ex Gao et al. 2016)]